MNAFHAVLSAVTRDGGYGIIRCRFGLGDGVTKSREEIAAEMIEKEVAYVREVEEKAIRDFGNVFNANLIKIFGHFLEP